MAWAALKSTDGSQPGSQGAAQGFGVPVALLNFNRPQMTRRVFEIIRQIKPRRLLLIADGPRPTRPDDERLCAEVRAVFDEINWDCEVWRNFSESNLGSFKRNSTGLDWVFDTVEEAIILEDDCVPSLSFFRYCEELLERYRNDARVSVISGNNLGFHEMDRTFDSYFFSAYAFTWGWATWRRVWQGVDLSMSWWDSGAGKETINSRFSGKAERQYWYDHFESIKNGKRRNAWDYQLLLSMFRHSQCCSIPRVNLVSNIGFGANSTNCIDEFSSLQNFPRDELEFPLIHPANVQIFAKVDSAIFHMIFQQKLRQRIKGKLARMFKQVTRGLLR